MDIFKKYGSSSVNCGCGSGDRQSVFYGGLDTGELNIVYTGPTGTDDYEKLINKPKINGIELKKDISLDDLGIASKEALNQIVFDFEDIPDSDLDEIMFGKIGG